QGCGAHDFGSTQSRTTGRQQEVLLVLDPRFLEAQRFSSRDEPGCGFRLHSRGGAGQARTRRGGGHLRPPPRADRSLNRTTLPEALEGARVVRGALREPQGTRCFQLETWVALVESAAVEQRLDLGVTSAE